MNASGRPLRIAFVMDPMERLLLDHDTTYALMVEADRRGHHVEHVRPGDVMAESGRAALRGRRFAGAKGEAPPYRLGPLEDLDPEAFDVVLIRTDPPFDADYLAVTQILDLLPPHIYVMNRPSGLRDANEKLAALHFPDLVPATLVSQDAEALDAFRRRLGGSMVLKPLDGHGGSGVVLLRPDNPNVGALLRAATADGTRKAIGQEVVPRAEEGDTRVLLLGGRPIGALLRRNEAGGFVHNLAAGGSALAAAITGRHREVADRLRPWLLERGLDFVGIDFLGDRLVEINVTSPTCVREINRLEGLALERTILDFVEAKARERRGASGH